MVSSRDPNSKANRDLQRLGMKRLLWITWDIIIVSSNMTQMKLPHPVVLPFQSEKVKQWLYIYKIDKYCILKISRVIITQLLWFLRWLSVPKENRVPLSRFSWFFGSRECCGFSRLGTRNSEMMDLTRQRCAGLSGLKRDSQPDLWGLILVEIFVFFWDK